MLDVLIPVPHHGNKPNKWNEKQNSQTPSPKRTKRNINEKKTNEKYQRKKTSFKLSINMNEHEPNQKKNISI